MVNTSSSKKRIRKKNKKYTKRNKYIPTLVKEHHKKQEWERGELAVDIGEDPDNPKQKVTRLRRKCVYDEMCSRGAITIEQCMAAERYAILCEQASGACGDTFARINLLRASRNKYEPSMSQHIAYKRLFQIWDGLGKNLTTIVDMVVLINYNCTIIGKILKISPNKAAGLICAAFSRLEELLN